MAPSWRSAAPVTVRPIVLVRGAVGDSDTFALTEGPLAERDTVWVYSRRCRGGSGDGPDYTYHREVEDVLAVLTAAGDRAHLSATPVARSTHCWPPRRHRRCGHSCSTSCRSSTTSTSASSTASLRCHGGQMPHRPPSRFHTLADGPPDVGVPSSGDPRPIPATRRRRTSMAAAGCVAQVSWRGDWRCRSSCGG
jgi:hypothetical protein